MLAAESDSSAAQSSPVVPTALATPEGPAASPDVTVASAPTLAPPTPGSMPEAAVVANALVAPPAEALAAPLEEAPGNAAVAGGECSEPAVAGLPCTGEPQEAGDPGEAGLLGKLKERVSEIGTVRKGMEFVVDTSKVVGQKLTESERVQQGVEFVKKKTTELAESERVQKGLEYAKDTAKAVSEKTQRGLEVVSEKTQRGLEFAKEKTRAVREGAGSVWEKGRGSIQRARVGVSKIAWRGSARETLDMAAREEQWRGIKVQGADEIAVPARTEHTSAYHVTKGSTLRWTFRVKDHDIGFGVRMRLQEWGGSREEEVLGMERYDSADTISGSWMADENRTIVLSFDNRYSRLRSKTVAYIVGTEKPPAFAEVSPDGLATSQPSSSAHAAAAPRAIV